jgi:hypothetical protein
MRVSYICELLRFFLSLISLYLCRLQRLAKSPTISRRATLDSRSQRFVRSDFTARYWKVWLIASESSFRDTEEEETLDSSRRNRRRRPCSRHLQLHGRRLDCRTYSPPPPIENFVDDDELQAAIARTRRQKSKKVVKLTPAQIAQQRKSSPASQSVK